MATQVEFPQTNAKNDKPTVSLLPSDKSNGKKRKSTIIIGTLVAILVIITACLVIAAVTETWPFAKEAHEQPKQPETDLTGQSNDNGLAANPGTVHIPQSAANPGTVHIPQSDAANPGTVHVPKSDAEAPSPVVIHSSRDSNGNGMLSPVEWPSIKVDERMSSSDTAPSFPISPTVHVINKQGEIIGEYSEDNNNYNKMDVGINAARCNWKCDDCRYFCRRYPYFCCDGKFCCCYASYGDGTCSQGGAFRCNTRGC